MKKIIGITTGIVTPFLTNAQNIGANKIDKEIFNVCATIFVVGLFMVFVLVILKRNLDFKLKNKIIEKGVSENIAASILEPSNKDERNSNIKWFAILTGLGLGFTIISYTLPLGIHSLAIMAFSIAAAFLGYFFFLRYTER